jgi:6-phosphofructokinase
VLNASLAGVIEESRKHTEITNLYGARYGLAGILREDFIDLFRQSGETISRIAHAPASALGTSRYNASQEDLVRVLEILRRHDVRYFFYAGGNGSMGTANQLDLLARASGQELHVVGIPKTIDNDLMETDHCPGYGSAARFFACAVRDIGADNRALPGQVEFVEVLGRNAGWIVAATSFARRREDDAPHLIYFPEAPLPLEQLLDDVQRVYQRLGRCVVAVCEGQLDESGQPFGADVRASSRGSLAMNLAHRLALLVSQRLKIRARSEKPGLLGRSCALNVSQSDWLEAGVCGRRAVLAGVRGQGGTMVTLTRAAGPGYAVDTGLVPLHRVALREREFPEEWRKGAPHELSAAFREYAAPLLGEIPQHAAFPEEK